MKKSEEDLLLERYYEKMRRDEAEREAEMLKERIANCAKAARWLTEQALLLAGELEKLIGEPETNRFLARLGMRRGK